MEEKDMHKNEKSGIAWWDKILSTTQKAIYSLGTKLVKFAEEEPGSNVQKTEAEYFSYVDYPNGPAEGINQVGNNDNLDKVEDEANIDEQQNDSQFKKGTEPVQTDISALDYKLARNTARLIGEYDRLAADFTDEVRKIMYNDAATKLVENLILSGCTGINPQEDEPFDFKRHISQPFSLAIDQPIKRTLRLGAALGDEVLVKAIVELKYNEKE